METTPIILGTTRVMPVLLDDGIHKEARIKRKSCHNLFGLQITDKNSENTVFVGASSEPFEKYVTRLWGRGWQKDDKVRHRGEAV